MSTVVTDSKQDLMSFNDEKSYHEYWMLLPVKEPQFEILPAAWCVIYKEFLFEHAIHFGLGFLPYSYHKNETDLQPHRSYRENIFLLTGWTLIISLLCIRFNLGPAGWEPQIPAFVFQTFNDIDLAFSLCLHCATPVWIVISSSSTPQSILLHPYNWVSNGALLAGPVLREDIWSSL